MELEIGAEIGAEASTPEWETALSSMLIFRLAIGRLFFRQLDTEFGRIFI
jgi:DNA-binding XRE family transcriptional regulator